MCGISGLWALDVRPDTLTSTVQAMTQGLAHRGPDSSGIWVHPQANGLALGHRRLSIYDLSAAGAQPMKRGNARYVLSFNGAIYNYRELREELIARGVSFKSESDTEVLLELLIMDGVARTLPRLEGMFAFAFWDEATEKLSLARDMWGKKPLLFEHTDTHFRFASELSAFHISIGGSKASLNEDAAHLMLAFGYVPEPLSILNGVQKLAPGHLLEVKKTSRGNIETALTSWSKPRLATEAYQGDVSTTFETLFTKSVAKRLTGDVPLGSFLSGGIDSSLVTAYAQKLHPQKLKTFTIGFDVEGFDESSYANDVAEHLGTEHHLLKLTGPDMAESCLAASSWFDEPFADTSAVPVRLLSAFTREHVTVALSGDGGDETCLGYKLHLKNTAMVSLLESVPFSLRAGAAALLFGNRGRWWQKTLRQKTPQDFYLSQRSGRFLSASGDLSALRDRLPELASRQSNSEWLGQCDLNTYLVDDMLTKTDRASMSVGLEVRSPLLDRNVASFVHSLPLDQKVNEDLGKIVLRRALDKFFPKRFFERPKSGFRAPIGYWLNTPTLSDWSHQHAECFDSRFGWKTSEGLSGVGLWEANKIAPEKHGRDMWFLSVLMDWILINDV